MRKLDNRECELEENRKNKRSNGPIERKTTLDAAERKENTALNNRSGRSKLKTKKKWFLKYHLKVYFNFLKDFNFSI